MEHILITGCAGFIGSHLCEELLAQGCHVTGMDNFDPFYPKAVKEQHLSALLDKKGFRFVEADIRDAEKLGSLQEPFSLVIHLASKAGVRPSIVHPAEYISVNIGGTNTLLEFMKTRGIRKMIFGSSSSIYGNNKKIPFSESDDVSRPISPYAATKRSAELLAYTYHHLYQIDMLCLRFFTVYGPRQRPDLAIRKFSELIAAGQPVPVYGDGKTARDYTYVSDIVAGITSAAAYLRKNEGVFEIINLGNSYPVTLERLVQQLHDTFGKEMRTERLPVQAGDVETTFADIRKASELLGYTPQVNFQDGLRLFVNWYLSGVK
jgi:UDP-glucuronate 4-epimerase